VSAPANRHSSCPGRISNPIAANRSMMLQIVGLPVTFQAAVPADDALPVANL